MGSIPFVGDAPRSSTNAPVITPSAHTESATRRAAFRRFERQASSTPTGGSNGGTGSTGSAPAGGDQASLEEWINYLKDYDKNVENGVESATDDFTDMIGSVGDSMANGNYGDGAQEFNDGLKDYVGDIFGSLTP